MKVIPILFAFALLMCPPEFSADAQDVVDFTNVPKRFANGSPSGGPVKNAGAAVLIVYLKAQKIAWLEEGKVVTCDLKLPTEKDAKKEGGPAPTGEYLIGLRYRHAQHNIDWYKLYPRKEDDSGYYPYDYKTKQGRSLIGLHPGTLSLGCVTIKANDYDKSEAWISLRKYVDAHKWQYNGSEYSGFLYVVD